MNVLEVQALTRRFDDLLAVDQMSFSIEAGSIFGFIGPNGSGKTTTMRMVATIDLPTGGDARVCGLSVRDRPDEVRPLLGYMPDRYSTYDDTTVGEYLDFFARAYGLRGAQRTQRIEGVLEFSGLTQLRDRLTAGLSKGMQQRVAMGRALLNDPQLLILDEPADGLDPRARIELRELLKVLAKQSKAILISSHILTELSELCDACAIIEKGRVLASGPVASIIAQSQGGVAAAAELVITLVSSPELEARRAQAERLLLEQPQVSRLVLDGPRLRLHYGGTEAEAARLLGVLVQANLPVCSFQRVALGLEEAFLSVTKGNVQ